MAGWFARFKMKVYVKRAGVYMRVTGPQELLDSVKGLGGHMVIGEEFELVSGIFFSGSNSVSDTSINGFEISDMTLVPLTEEDRSELNL